MANYDLTYEGSRVQSILDTGDELRDAGYIFRGEATPSTVPGTPTERVAYIGGPGTYTNFGSSITVGAGCICVFKYTGSAWSNQVINTGLDSAVNTLQSAITAINNNIGNGYVYAGVATPSTSPVTGKVFYLAVQAGTYTNFGNAVVTAGLNVLKKNGSAWSVDQFIAIDAEPTQGSANLVKSGGVLNSIIQNGPAFDLSAYNAEGGVLATYADLSAALTALNALPADFKKGGMSMKYVQTSDNKYIQARCMAQSFTTDVTQWQNVDDKISELEGKVGELVIGFVQGSIESDGHINAQNTNYISSQLIGGKVSVKVRNGFVIRVYGEYNGDTFNKIGENVYQFEYLGNLPIRFSVKRASSGDITPDIDVVEYVIVKDSIADRLGKTETTTNANSQAITSLIATDVTQNNAILHNTNEIGNVNAQINNKVVFSQGTISSDGTIDPNALNYIVSNLINAKFFIKLKSGYTIRLVGEYSSAYNVVAENVYEYSYNGDDACRVVVKRDDGTNIVPSEDVVSEFYVVGSIGMKVKDNAFAINKLNAEIAESKVAFVQGSVQSNGSIDSTNQNYIANDVLVLPYPYKIELKSGYTIRLIGEFDNNGVFIKIVENVYSYNYNGYLPTRMSIKHSDGSSISPTENPIKSFSYVGSIDKRLTDIIDSLGERQSILSNFGLYRYITTSFLNDGGKGLFVLGTNDLCRFTLLNKDFPFKPSSNEGVRDPAIMFHDGYYYVVYTIARYIKVTNQIGLARTKNFIDWEEFPNITISGANGESFVSGYCWAPAFFKDIDGKIYIVCGCSVTASSSGMFHYIMEYNPETKNVGLAFKTNIPFIDGHIYKENGYYYLLGSKCALWKSANLLSSSWVQIHNESIERDHYEAQFALKLDNGKWRLFAQNVASADDNINDTHYYYQDGDTLEGTFTERKLVTYDNETLSFAHTQNADNTREYFHFTIYDKCCFLNNNGRWDNI